MTEMEIKKEILDFIKEFVPVPATNCDILLYDDKGIQIFDIFERNKLINRIYEDIAIFASRNEEEECKTIEGLWEYCKKKVGFGDICTLYYEDNEYNFIRFADGTD